MYEHNALGYRSGLAICLTKVTTHLDDLEVRVTDLEVLCLSSG